MATTCILISYLKIFSAFYFFLILEEIKTFLWFPKVLFIVHKTAQTLNIHVSANSSS